MATPSMKKALAACLVPMIAACTDQVVSPAASANVGRIKSIQLPTEPSPGHEGEADQFDIAKEIPSYGGHYFDTDGRVIVWLTDVAKSTEAKSAIRRRISNRKLRTFGQAMPEVQARPASYSFRQLAYWRDQLAAVAPKVGARFLDLNERENRVTIGLSRTDTRTDLDAQLLTLDIPREAVTIEASNPTFAMGMSGFFQSATHQRMYADTLAGGLQYTWYDILNTTSGYCTIGFATSTSAADVGFISAGHCSPQKWTTDGYYGSKIGQPSSANNIGYELYDPAPGTCPVLWGCDHYRFADANLNKITGRPVKVGYLVAPNSRLGSSGVDTTLYANWYIPVVGTTSSISAGSVIDKIGRSTGWHYGTVNNTCSDNWVGSWPDVQMVRCAYSINTSVDDGDSGGPVFYYSGGEATAAGIVHAKDGTSKAWFSKWMYVESELTGSSPGPTSLSIVAPSPPPAPSVTIYGPSAIKPNATCYWYVSSSFEYTGVEWKVNGSVVGTNYDLYLSRASSFTLDVTVTDGVRWAQKSLAVNVSSDNGTCAVE